jgi:hypothetical protein
MLTPTLHNKSAIQTQAGRAAAPRRTAPKATREFPMQPSFSRSARQTASSDVVERTVSLVRLRRRPVRPFSGFFPRHPATIAACLRCDTDLADKRRGFEQVWVWGAADRRQSRPIAYV